MRFKVLFIQLVLLATVTTVAIVGACAIWRIRHQATCEDYFARKGWFVEWNYTESLEDGGVVGWAMELRKHWQGMSCIELNGPPDRRSLELLRDCRTIKTLGMTGKGVTDDTLANIESCLPSVTVLDVSESSVTNGSVDLLSRLQNLRELYLNGSEIDAASERRLRLALPTTDIYR